MKAHEVKSAQLYQIIMLDATKFGTLDQDRVDKLVNSMLAVGGESEFKTKTCMLLVLPTMASDSLRGVRGLEGERVRFYNKLTSKGLVVTAVHITCSKALLGNAAKRSSVFPAFLCMSEDSCPPEGIKVGAAKREEKKEGVNPSESQINAFLSSELYHSLTNDVDNLPKMIPESWFVVPRDIGVGPPETSSETGRRRFTDPQFHAQQLAGSEIPLAIMKSLLQGTNIPPHHGVLVFHLSGYEGWFEKSLIDARFSSTLPSKLGSVTFCIDQKSRAAIKWAVREQLLAVLKISKK